jgi:hypothetical protein
MHSTMRAYDSLMRKTTHGCVEWITQRSRGGGGVRIGRHKPAIVTSRRAMHFAKLSANEIVLAVLKP